MAIIFDIAILAILVLFVVLGWRRGLLLSLCGLAVVVVAFLAAGFLADALETPVADTIRPKLEEAIQRQIALHGDDLDMDSPVDVLRDMGGPFRWAADGLEDVQDAAVSTVEGIAHKGAQLAAAQIAHGAVFTVAFLILVILLNLLLRALNVVARLPGLRFCNGLGGAVIGLVKAVLILFVAAAVLQLAARSYMTPEVVERSYLLKPLLRYDPILALFR